ncbi:DUF1129 family protein [Paenibacillus rhizophilus]|uniref:DUF1129 family protein n=2 Tax=Paenibacillus rhizophilus TaxID=1850366 RepID=A0A3N9P544_9BACL|nr:DUF1129 family protein [Paenibacillus rhizophilus]
MKVKDMIKENNRLREQMTPFNRSYMEDMIIALRASRINKLRTEELLLEAAHTMLKAQARGKNAKQVFGDKPEEYFKAIMDETPERPVFSRQKIVLMIPWVALTWLFGVLAAGGLLSLWITGTAGMFGQIGLFTLISVGLGSIIFVGLIMKWLGSLSEDDAPKAGKFDLKSLGTYVAVAVIIVTAGLLLGKWLPAFTLSPWVSLIVFAAGLIGQRLLFRRK